jgi:hypothetical protein
VVSIVEFLASGYGLGALIAAVFGAVVGYGISYAISLCEQPFYRYLERHTRKYSNDAPTDIRTVEKSLPVSAEFEHERYWAS